MIGIEPTCLAALDPKSSASASFATSAMGCKSKGFVETKNFIEAFLEKKFQ